MTAFKVCGIPHLAKNERDAPNFMYAALERTACALLFKERRVKFREPTKTTQEIGDVGHPEIGDGVSPGAWTEFSGALWAEENSGRGQDGQGLKPIFFQFVYGPTQVVP
jgi:hypothetical protein